MAVEQVYRIPQGLPPIGDLEDAQTRAEHASALLCGESWLRIVREQPHSVWIELARSVLDPVYEGADPPVARMPANDLVIMDAWNARLVVNDAAFRSFVEAPFRIASKPRLRPDLRFGRVDGFVCGRSVRAPRSSYAVAIVGGSRLP